ncbi:MAG: cobyrinic acid a,c-diamide synthase, partial [Rhodospirillaceae bacterium]|nr:cobyrinic acid a,c-diamide synthase [Rhodospirillaceae bacterium]
FGILASDPELTLRERHLGLVQASEREDLDQLLDHAADVLSRDLDLAGLQAIAARPTLDKTAQAPSIPPLGQRITVARDIAFGFCYPHVLDDWRAKGADISFFSPLADQGPDADADAVYLPGGYPELHAATLAANRIFLTGLREAGENGTVILGECGGYMVLGQGVVDGDGVHHAMAGLLNLETSFAKRKLHLGYRQMTLREAGVLGAKGTQYRGHEFHYASVGREKGPSLYAVTDALGEQEQQVGLRKGKIMGSFIHLIDIDQTTTT